ncbi:MAG: uracil-DNA glycosylase [Proteobacteria bacterium]|jgi:uracil-DNA glycosylase|nr:uracil-DNA glycosylase [Alphaproteobacteria bacterium]NCC04210.1 uracil-DNA glycosylase [Pseudomonadota bacterium]
MTQETAVRLEAGWFNQVGGEFDKPYMKELKTFLHNEKQSGKVIFPPGSQIFTALNTTAFSDVKVVIIGQDPYHGRGQAHGLCFSVQNGVALPPSLINIYKELSQEFGVPMPRSGNLSGWAEQGVLLLNATLTVREGQAGSHQNKGWETFTDAVIRAVNEQHEHVVFMLWGSYAQKKGAVIDRSRHLVLQAPHPSPLSAHRGFLGCGHFRAANDYLEKNGRTPIDWIKDLA